jgi:hypothetical protein
MCISLLNIQGVEPKGMDKIIEWIKSLLEDKEIGDMLKDLIKKELKKELKKRT